MTMSALKVHLYSIPLPPDEQAKFNIMHSTYLLINTSNEITDDALISSTHCFTSLLSKHFTKDLKVSSSSPRRGYGFSQLKEERSVPGLQECTGILFEVAMTVGQTNERDIELSRRILEGLMEHFFLHNNQ